MIIRRESSCFISLWSFSPCERDAVQTSYRTDLYQESSSQFWVVHGVYLRSMHVVDIHPNMRISNSILRLEWIMQVSSPILAINNEIHMTAWPGGWGHRGLRCRAAQETYFTAKCAIPCVLEAQPMQDRVSARKPTSARVHLLSALRHATSKSMRADGAHAEM